MCFAFSGSMAAAKAARFFCAEGHSESPSGPEKAEECVRGVVDCRHLQVQLLTGKSHGHPRREWELVDLEVS